MITPINITIDGGTQPERDVISWTIEGGLTAMGFVVENTAMPDSPDSEDVEKTLLDYAVEANPNLFSRPITISQTTEDEDIIVDEVEDEDDVESDVDE